MNNHKSLLVSVVVVLNLVAVINGHQLPNGGKIWALLVAGSSGYDNYRHQADICHAYQILHANGIPDENIIVMMYDDIAYNSQNPYKGTILNWPENNNVYKGVPKDYTKSTVNSTNFLKILSGDEEGMKGIGSGRVIKSGPNDHVFVNFADHGGTGMLGFPDDLLYASDLIATLKKMAAKNQFGKLVFYVEACESGSMFDNLLPDDLNIFVLTASDPHESSYACCYDDNLQNYRGDMFSVLWMYDTEKENLIREELHHQFEVVRTETNTSHVEEYGDLDVGSMHVADFMGFTTTKYRASISNHLQIAANDVVSSRDVTLSLLERKKEAAKNPKEKKLYEFKIHRLLKSRRHLEKVIDDILLGATGMNEAKVELLKNDKYKLKLEDYDCYKKLVSSFSESCFKISKNPHVLSQLYLFANICGRQDINQDEVVKAITHICSSQPLIVGVN